MNVCMHWWLVRVRMCLCTSPVGQCVCCVLVSACVHLLVVSACVVCTYVHVYLLLRVATKKEICSLTNSSYTHEFELMQSGHG